MLSPHVVSKPVAAEEFEQQTELSLELGKKLYISFKNGVHMLIPSNIGT